MAANLITPYTSLDDGIGTGVEMLQAAVAQYQPYFTIALISGGIDSLTAYQVAKRAGVVVDAILHIRTRTGIPETSTWVRWFALREDVRYIEADAGDAFERRVRDKGFYGIGNQAHSFAYHQLKHGPLRHAISWHIRRNLHKRRILLINGARMHESATRKRKHPDPVRVSGANIWVSPIHGWNAAIRHDMLATVEAPINPVTKLHCRSGECFCGTTQKQAQRTEAAYWYPVWGQWMDALDRHTQEVHGYGWGMAMPGQLTGQPLHLRSPARVLCGSCIEGEPT